MKKIISIILILSTLTACDDLAWQLTGSKDKPIQQPPPAAAAEPECITPGALVGLLACACVCGYYVGYIAYSGKLDTAASKCAKQQQQIDSQKITIEELEKSRDKDSTKLDNAQSMIIKLTRKIGELTDTSDWEMYDMGLSQILALQSYRYLPPAVRLPNGDTLSI